MPDLTEYVKNLKKQGYNSLAIKNVLQRYGYPQNVIDQAVAGAGGGKKGPKHMIIFLSVIIVAFIIGAFFILKPSEGIPTARLEVSLGEVDREVTAGEELSAVALLSAVKPKETGDIYMKYELFDESRADRLSFKSEAIPFTESKQHSFMLDIPQNAKSGNYILKVTARHKAESSTSEQRFSIKGEEKAAPPEEEPTPEEPFPEEPATKCPPSCNDGNPSTRDYCDASTDFRCEHEDTSVCGDGDCSFSENSQTCPRDCETQGDAIVMDSSYEKLESIKQLAPSDPEAAKQECDTMNLNYRDECYQAVGEISNNANLCDKVGDNFIRDKCFSNVAISLERPALCENIPESRRDSCYVNFAVEGDYSVCEKLLNPYLKKSCTTMQNAAQFEGI
jgi:hypothetical protein